MKYLTLLVFAILLSTPGYAKDKNDSIEDAIRDEIRKEIDGDDHKGGKGKGRPDNPGEHGRDNAAEKQRQNPGKGSKGDDSWEDRVRDAIDDDDHDRDKKNGKGKDKKKK